jgi:molybdopterin synthase sulfur carrier subunit
MPHVSFTPHLQRFVDAPARKARGATVAAALADVFADNPRLRGYVLDERGAVRQHVTIFVDDAPIRDRVTLTDPVSDEAEIFVLQALSGGSSSDAAAAVDRHT